MRFIQTPLPGTCVIELDLLSDDRGWFARTFDSEEFQVHGLDPAVIQCNASFNAQRDTLRGMHYQSEPHGESKLVRCVRGRIFDVAVDLRPESPSRCRWHAVELSERTVAPSTSQRGWRMASRRSPTTAKSSTRWAIPTCPGRPVGCGGTTQRSGSSGRR